MKVSRKFPTALSDSCKEFRGRLLKVKLSSGWGWHQVERGAHKPVRLRDVATQNDLIISVDRFFRERKRLRGFVGTVYTKGHPFDGLRAVLFTMSDGLDFDFRENICMVWGARFGQREPSSTRSTIPAFTGGTVYTGYATVFDDYRYLLECQKRLSALDPRNSAPRPSRLRE
jgi:hypothetical protein